MINWAATVAAAVSLVLVLVNAGLVLNNQTVQNAVSARAQLIGQGQQLIRLDQVLVASLELVVANTKDQTLRDLLTRYGVKLPAEGAAPAPGAAAPIPAPAPTPARPR